MSRNIHITNKKIALLFPLLMSFPHMPLSFPRRRESSFNSKFFLASLLFLIVLSTPLALAGTYSGGTGDPNNPYLIDSADDIIEMSNTPDDWNKNFLMIADVNMIEHTFIRACIAPDTGSRDLYQGTPFKGTFDGGFHKILNFTIDAAETDNDFLGFFGLISSESIIRNVGLINASITGGQDSMGIGALCATNQEATIINCYSTGTIKGKTALGGLCASNMYGTIINCYSNCDVGDQNSESLGGFCTSNAFGTITNCYNTGTVSGHISLGGFCGANTGTIQNCYTACAINAGIDSEMVGALCAYQWDDNALISNCFWDTDTTQMDVGYNLSPTYPGTVTNVLGKTTTEMQTQSTFTDYGWDFVGEDVNGSDDIWRMCVEGVYYAKLWWQYSTLGDFDCPDGVGLEDLLMLTDYWLETELEPLQSPDADGDGKANLDDFAITSQNFLTQ